jgi:hypothetical protein
MVPTKMDGLSRGHEATNLSNPRANPGDRRHFAKRHSRRQSFIGGRDGLTVAFEMADQSGRTTEDGVATREQGIALKRLITLEEFRLAMLSDGSIAMDPKPLSRDPAYSKVAKLPKSR